MRSLQILLLRLLLLRLRLFSPPLFLSCSLTSSTRASAPAAVLCSLLFVVPVACAAAAAAASYLATSPTKPTTNLPEILPNKTVTLTAMFLVPYRILVRFDLKISHLATPWVALVKWDTNCVVQNFFCTFRGPRPSNNLPGRQVACFLYQAT